MYFDEEEIRRLVLADVAIAQRWSERRWQLFSNIVIGNPKIESGGDLAKVGRALQTFSEDKLGSLRYHDVMDLAGTTDA